MYSSGNQQYVYVNKSSSFSSLCPIYHMIALCITERLFVKYIKGIILLMTFYQLS